MIVKNKLLNYSNAYIYQDTEYFKMSLDSLLLAKFVIPWVKCYREREGFDAEEIIPFLHQGRP